MLGRNRNRALGAAVIALAMGISGCTLTTAQLKSLLQGAINSIWSTPSKRATIEVAAEQQLDTELKKIEGTVIETPFGVPDDLLVVKFTNEDVSLGSVAPTTGIPSSSFFESSTYYYVYASWTLSWVTPTNLQDKPYVKCHIVMAGEDFGDWFCPDLDATVTNPSVQASGNGYVLVPKNASSASTVSIVVTQATIGLSAKARGEILGVFSFTIDFSKEARAMVKEALVKNVIGKAITFQINAIDFTKF